MNKQLKEFELKEEESKRIRRKLEYENERMLREMKDMIVDVVEATDVIDENP